MPADWAQLSSLLTRAVILDPSEQDLCQAAKDSKKTQAFSALQWLATRCEAVPALRWLGTLRAHMYTLGLDACNQ